MEPSVTAFIIVCPMAFLAALVDSIAGGGGLISLPAYIIAGVPPHFAVATNKLSSFIGTSVSAFRYLKNGAVDLKLAPGLVALALAGSALGANLVLLVEEDIIKKLLLIVLPVVAFLVLRKNSLSEGEDPKEITRKKQVIIAMITSFVVGTYDGFYGPGTGTFLVLIYSGVAGMDIRTASGNTKIVNLSSNLAALVTFLLYGKVLLLLGVVAGVFGIAGNYIGSGLVLKNGVKVVKPILLVVLALLFVKILTEL